MTRPLSFRVAEQAPEPEFVPYRRYGLAIAGAVIVSLILWIVAIWLAPALHARRLRLAQATAGGGRSRMSGTASPRLRKRTATEFRQEMADKGLRIERLQPHVLNGSIRFHAGQSALLAQLRHYPMVDHDDGLDCLEMLWMTAIGRPPAAGSTVGPAAPRRGGLGVPMRGRQSMRMRRR